MIQLFKYHPFLTGILTGFLLLTGCNFEPDKIKPPGWQTRILGPLAKFDASVDNMLNGSTGAINKGFQLKDLGFQDNYYPSIDDIDTVLGPYTLNWTEQLEDANIQDQQLTIKVQNEWPLDIDEDTKLVFKAPGSEEVLFAQDFGQPIRKGETLTFDIPVEALNKFAGQQLQLYLNPLDLIGDTSGVNIDPQQQLKLTFAIDQLDYELELTPSDDDLVFSAKADFNLKGDVIKTQPVEGTFTLHVNNDFPLTLEMQGYFVKKDKDQIIDSLFEERAIIQSSKVNNQGYSKISNKSKFVVTMRNKKIKRINEADQITAFMKMATTANRSTVKVQKTDSLNMQLVGKLTLNVD